MARFLTVVPVDDAVAAAVGLARTVDVETVMLENAGGRVLARDIATDADLPGFARSTVDGYAVRAAETVGASESLPSILRLKGRVAMGAGAPFDLRSGECAYVPTGGEVPVGADAVVMVEYAEIFGDEVLIGHAVAVGENVVLPDEDFASGEVVVQAGRRLSPQDIGALAAVGKSTVEVRRRPVIGVISTGNEVVPVETVPGRSQVRDVNSYLCRSFCQERGCETRFYGIVRDEAGALRASLERAAVECDAVLVSGGSSKDDRDMGARTIAELGEVLVHGIALAPGKPTIIGRVGTIPAIGLPGHPASAFVVLLVIAGPLLAGLTGDGTDRSRRIRGRLAENVPSARGREDYVRVTVRGGMVRPIFAKSGLLNSLVRADGLLPVPAGREGYETGDDVEVLLF
jgi:molybdopterin molybdotransferase